MRKKLYSFLLLTICVSIISTTWALAVTTVDVKISQDSTYTNLYSLSSDKNNMLDTFANVKIPFNEKWNIELSESIYNLNKVVTEDCPRADSLECNTTNCGSVCKNSYITTSNHHKNLGALYHQIKNSDLRGTYDVQITATSVKACYDFGKGHSATILGLGATNYAAVVQDKTRGMLGNVRVIQHELSHGFGCSDDSCTPGQNCIMSGGFDNNTNYNLKNIWCTNCQNKFNANTY